MADDICMHALNETDSIFNEIQDACEEDPRDDEDVIDAYARLASEQLPKEGLFIHSVSFVCLSDMSTFVF